ncbi:MAG: ABC transporter permease [Saprospiraceae bacterium]
MNNILLILQREFWTRVKSKSFLLTTFLAPIGIVVFYAALFFIMSRGSDNIKNLAVVDRAGIVDQSETKRNNLELTYDYTDLESAKEAYLAEKIDGIIELPPIQIEQTEYDIIFHSDDQLAIDETSTIERMFRKKVRNYKVQKLGIDQSQLDLIDTDLNVSPRTIKDTEKDISSLTSTVSSVLGGIVGFLLFMMVMIYGSQVMRSVSEEKINRIVEVLISSVKPFQLMMGKILGVGSVGLLQVFIWIILMILITVIGTSILGISSMDLGADTAVLTETMAQQGINIDDKIFMILKELSSINWAMIVPLYIFYFFVGYLTYSALFAAVGSAMGDDVQDAQALTMLATIPMVIAFYIAIAAVTAPHSSMAVWSSILPFFGPVVMPVRLAVDPPLWQIIASVLSSIITVIALTWLAGRIYRVGILMYGKKASFKELGKWIFYKG